MPAPVDTDVFDVLFDFSQGMNSDLNPLLLPKNQAAFITNGTVRGNFFTDRPKYRKIAMDFGGDADLQTAVENGLWQGGTYYKPDTGLESLVVAIAGRLFDVVPDPTAATAVVTEETVPGDPNPAARTQAWLWQAENYVIWNDGLSNPVFFDGTTSVRSNYFSTSRSLGLLSADVLITAAESIGNSVTIPLTINPTGIVVAGDLVYVPSDSFVTSGFRMVVRVVTVNVSDIQGINTNLFADATHQTSYQAGIPVSYSRPSATQLPPGRMGTYAMGRNWVVLVDGKQFIGSDIVGGSSGTVANNFRDSVLNITENNYLAGGGYFTIPGSIGDIRFIRAMATLDRSLGQGAVQVGTPNAVFSLNATVNRLEWQDMTNPILTQSGITFGGLGQNSTVNLNSDLWMRSVDGIRSMQQARKDFSLPGNTPDSVEMNRVLIEDDLSLMEYGSAVVFDNRLLMTAHPTASDQGVFHPGLIALNLDPLSSLGKKSPAVYDGLFTGINILQVMRGQFSGKERCFAFCFNETDAKIELWEILKDNEAYLDDGTIPVTWAMESPAIFANVPRKTLFDAVRLQDAELTIDDLKGSANVRVEFKPNGYPCWRPWKNFTICSSQTTTDPNVKPGYRTRLSLGQPPNDDCEPINNAPFCNGYWFQVRITIQGHLRLLMIRFRASDLPQPRFSPVVGCCDSETVN